MSSFLVLVLVSPIAFGLLYGLALYWLARYRAAVRSRHRLASDCAIQRLYSQLDLEYQHLHFGPGIRRTPLREVFFV